MSSLLTSQWSDQVTWLPPDLSWQGPKRLHDKNMTLRSGVEGGGGEAMAIFALYQNLFKYWDAVITLIFK